MPGGEPSRGRPQGVRIERTRQLEDLLDDVHVVPAMDRVEVEAFLQRRERQHVGHPAGHGRIERVDVGLVQRDEREVRRAVARGRPCAGRAR